MFKVKDLKNGMVVEFNDGKRRLVWENKLIDNHGYVPLGFINDSLYDIDRVDNKYIVKIYLTHNVGYFNAFFREENLTCIWDRYKSE